MHLDLVIVLFYFIGVMGLALSGRSKSESTSSEEYFLSGRRLPWYSIAISTIATNIGGAHFLGMMGSAYLYGIAQANFEINAVQGILLAAFVFVPLYLRSRVVTITQFIQLKLGTEIARLYSVANVLLFMTLYLGAALFWGAYAADLVFSDYLLWISADAFTRISVLVIALGVFSAIYTYMGGLSAVVRTDLLQFAILVTGGVCLTTVAIRELGGWGQLWVQVPEKMHLHLPADHEKLPWTHLFGLFLLNINYWCANQAVIQRSLAAKSLRHAQIGLLTGGALKYLMAIIIIVPGVALFGVLGDQLAADPDQAFPYLVTEHLPDWLGGLILCALFASMMSTVDSTFNSAATLVSVDLMKGWFRPNMTEVQMVATGRRTILAALVTGIGTALLLTYAKVSSSEVAFTHTLNELRYYVNCGIVVTIIAAAFFLIRRKLDGQRESGPIWPPVMIGILLTVPLNLAFKQLWVPEMNYILRAGIVIAIGLLVVLVFAARFRFAKQRFEAAGRDMVYAGFALACSLILLHVVFH